MSDPYRPGQYPPSGLDQTTRIPPVRSNPAPRPPAGKPGGKTREYVLKGLGLVLVAVLSGMFWWLIQQGGNEPGTSGQQTTPVQPQTKYQFTRHQQVSQPAVDSNCARNSYDDIQRFFEKKPCTRMVRELYTANVNGRTAYISVAMVRMSNAADAAELKSMTETNGTGNVTDLVREGRVKVQGLRNLSNGGFAASVNGTDVVVIEADYEGGSKDQDEAQLDEVASDALKIGDALRN